MPIPRPREYPFSAIERASIGWCDEIIRKYAEGVRAVKPRVERSGTLGTKDQLTSAALSERTALVFGTQGSASLHPGLYCSYAFGVFPDNLVTPT